ncbi:hypothetical protein CTAM01_12692 [Colletotrichum tamarilloi]|uniref:Ankyrin repeat protein n=1 Tax=Colletotrichum tamarilloi TaxID=1209934 RepID=A0ABQ9QTX1_9PEZI|nr:uncharacterized protein CTAM01_12692 [Colletotrichum tamarilloi]KAK1485066.1 hypothetical protein CTAM01_12692 [Colletotrichum tamarilloi]
MSSMSPNPSAVMANPGSTARVFQHRRERPSLPDGYIWETQGKKFSPRNLLLNPVTEGSLRSEFGLVFCHRGLYERASRIVENSFAAIDNGISEGLFLHEIDGFVPETLKTAVVAHDKIARRVTRYDKPWGHISLLERYKTALVTRNIENLILDPSKPGQPEMPGQPGLGPPDLASSYLDTNEKVLALFDVLWREKFGNRGHTLQYDLRDNDLANAIPYYSFHISKHANGRTTAPPLVHSMFQSVMLKGYNVVYRSFDHLIRMVEAASCAQYGYNYFEKKQLPMFPAMVMVFHAQPIIDLAMESEPINVLWDKRSYEHIYDIAMKQIMSYVGIGEKDRPYNFILEITHSGLGLGYKRETDEAKNPLNGELIRDEKVKFESRVDRVLIDVALKLRDENSKLLFSSCTRLPDYIKDQKNYKANWQTSHLEAWKDPKDESGLSAVLRAVHGGLYPQSDIVVADDPFAEIAARSWIDQEFALDRRELLSGIPYCDWLKKSRGRGTFGTEYRKRMVESVKKLNASFKANTYGGDFPDMVSSPVRPDIPEGPRVTNESIDQWLASMKDSRHTMDTQSAYPNSSIGEEGNMRDDRNEGDDWSTRDDRSIRDGQDEQTGFAIQIEGKAGLVFNFPGDANRALSKLREQGVSGSADATTAQDTFTTITIGSAKFRFISRSTSIQPIFTRAEKAAYEGNVMLLKKIIAEARDIERMPERLATELGLACEQGHLEVIELLLSYMPDINVEGRDGLPLALACSAGREEAVRKLLDRGGDVNFAVRLCEAPLSAACRSGNKDIVELLLRKGADPTIQTLFNPMAQAASNGHTHIVKILLSHEKRRSKSRSVADFAKNALHDACFYGESGIVKLLLQEGADINLQGGHEGSPLHAACSQGHMKTVCVLLENKANIDLERNGETALGVACARGHYAVAELLLARGASIRAPIRRSGMVYERPLERAYKAGNTSIVKLLLARGALIDFTVDTETRNTEVALLLLPTWRPAQPRLVDSSLFAFRRKPFEVGVPKKKPVAPHRAVKKLPDCGCLICWMDAYGSNSEYSYDEDNTNW